MECSDCKHWENERYGYGNCNKMKEKVDVELVLGWEGGYLKTFDTEADFGCILFEKREVSKCSAQSATKTQH